MGSIAFYYILSYYLPATSSRHWRLIDAGKRNSTTFRTGFEATLFDPIPSVRLNAILGKSRRLDFIYARRKTLDEIKRWERSEATSPPSSGVTTPVAKNSVCSAQPERQVRQNNFGPTASCNTMLCISRASWWLHWPSPTNACHRKKN